MVYTPHPFDIRNWLEFRNGRASCPCCEQEKGKRNQNLSLVPGTDGAYKCHRGCSGSEIRAALGAPSPRQSSLGEPQKQKAQERQTGTVAVQAPLQKDYTVDEAYVQRSVERLLHHQGEPQRQATAWLEGRGFTCEMMAYFRLGLERTSVKNDLGETEYFWALAIFIPVPEKPGRYYKKMRVAPWLTGDDRPPYLKRWSQYGVPTTIFLTHSPDNPAQTWFCEGEWDAMRLGWEARTRGEKVAIACSTGGCGSVPKPSQLQRLTGEVIIFYDRNDVPDKKGKRPGDEGAQKLALALSGRGRIAQVPMPQGCDIQGYDVSNALDAGFSWDNFRQAVQKASQSSFNYNQESGDNTDNHGNTDNGSNGNGNGADGHGQDPRRPNRKEIKTFCQIAFADLYNDKPWIYVHKKLHYWTGTHYEPSPTEVEIARINHFCDNYAVPVLDKTTQETYWFYKYAKPSYVNAVLEWTKQKLSIDPNLVNPPGINCVDGVLQLSYDPVAQRWDRDLIPHDPQMYYLYAPQVIYNIPAVLKSDACDRLLSCLDSPERDIFLKTVAASLDMHTVRRYKGRSVRALLLQGLGNNGKDTLREVTAMMYGYRGMVGATLSDFKQYDEGRKFPLVKLDGANINWPSENADCMLIDRIQSAKIAITGDPLAGEKKGKDEYQFRPKCAMFFNINDPPRLLGSMEAIDSRYAILKFTKTYKAHPKPGELEADPRFLYDPEFVRTEVLPWYLRYVLNALDRLMVEGINYSCTEAAMEEVREKSDHIYAFCKDVAIDYLPHGRLYATEVYSRLRQWYIADGTLEVKELGDGTTKDIWHSQTTWGDHTVRGLNQIFPRLLKLFPKAVRERDSVGRHYLYGLGFILPGSHPPGGGSPGSHPSDSGSCRSNSSSGVSPGINSPGGSPSSSPSDRFSGLTSQPDDALGNFVSSPNISEDGLKESEARLNVVNPNSSKHSEAAEDEFTLTERIKNLMSLLTVQEHHQLLVEMGSKISATPEVAHQVQDVQNQVTVSDTASSEVLQSSSEDIQKCISTTPNDLSLALASLTSDSVATVPPDAIEPTPAVAPSADEIQVGDTVANNEPKAESYHWRGTVVRLYTNPMGERLADVRWSERRALKLKGEVLTSRLSQLRKVE